MSNLFEEMKNSIINCQEDKALKLAQISIEQGVNSIDAITKGFAQGLKYVGDRYKEGELFLPDLLYASNIMKSVTKHFEDQLHLSDTVNTKKKGVVVIGTVLGDIHDIGKNLVRTLLSVHDIHVIDIGVDCPAEVFIKKAQEESALIIGASALLTTTMYEQKNIISMLERDGLRNKYKFIVGGAAVTREWAESIGADGYGENAQEAVDIVLQLFEESRC